ncbi:MAG TPA: DNA topoisomerase IB [Candidatus Limnocylindria bacterium]|jgi:DNA topoisomerase-1|nr:DNA topoisomerase IB [Candidatus Limnocylindria bacterium]
MEPLDGPEAAKAAGLRYTTDAAPGIRRRPRRGGFSYIGVDGKPLTDRAELARIAALAVPPAYTDVWISPHANGHLQATGRDARGRKQYRYHKRWRAVRDETKFDRMLDFAKALPTIRRRVAQDLRAPGLPREKVLATVVSLLEATAIRVGNEEYARANGSFGLTTLHADHAQVQGATIRLRFTGKSGKRHDVTLRDPRLAKIVRAARDLPGQRLFEYLDDEGQAHPVDSEDVNAYLQEISGERFTAKDFRTWEATVGCALELGARTVDGVSAAKKTVVEAVERVAARLGNTPAVCRKSYIHPGVLAEFMRRGTLRLAVRGNGSAREHALSAEERAVVALVERLAAAEREPLEKVLAASVRAERSRRSRAA